jgi:hypothetical protein
MEVSGQFHAPVALSPGRESPAVWAPESGFAPAGNPIPVVQPIV